MLTLGIDTAEPIGGVSLFEEGVCAEERLMEAPLQHAERLIPLVRELVEGSSRTLQEVACVSVNLGPGSFTGLRIGLATGKGLCHASGAALVGVDGTVAYRSRVPEERRVCVVLRSRRDLFYVRWFAGDRPKGTTCLIRERSLIERLRQEKRELTLVGSGAEAIREHVVDHALLRIGPEPALRPSPLTVARIGATQVGDSLYELEPIYIEPVFE